MDTVTQTLAGKQVLILGGSSGLGLATAKAAANAGASVMIVSGNQQNIDKALKELPAGSKGYAVDLRKEENIKAFFEQSSEFDHLVYTAGENLRFITLNDMDIDKAKEFFTLRYWSALAVVKYGVAKIRKGGSIGLISGIVSQRPGAGWSLAASICGAVEAFGRAMAIELAPIRVNVVVAGVTKTNLWNSLSETDRNNLYSAVSNSLLVKRVGEAEEIAQTFLFLMHNQFATGQTFTIDGGTVLV
ncbi:short-chain dehydrogenase [Niastella yeongjuensis]|uniref:Short-chain dehydrogenase n=1 Tax=Niastella yeongjuensis TaxID=354355 RepID=A0A1V9EGB1_9BACT|nr:SDR family oxidoreductase [Niastella yeongjuensis]OQP45168.1 short-chain dehydrogenase [Niastella yeongjuensis]SEP48476.1 NAD(P)-dependent dehydrogenase, short-chain alcohol dehydrogenase family [Niastella yeongjuensis]